MTLLARITRSPTRLSCPTWLQAIRRQSDPTRVMPSPPTLPRWMVTCSRNWVLAPITQPVGSPLYFKSCGASPMEEKGESRHSAPIVVCPSMTTCEVSSTSASRTTDDPTTQKGPIRQPGPTTAPGSITDEGWIMAVPAIRSTCVTDPESWPHMSLRRQPDRQPWPGRQTSRHSFVAAPS